MNLSFLHKLCERWGFIQRLVHFMVRTPHLHHQDFGAECSITRTVQLLDFYHHSVSESLLGFGPQPVNLARGAKC